jgi:hypothetical protein
VEIIGRMAASWNIPVITPVGLDSEFDNRTYFPTLTRLSYSIDQIGKFYSKVFEIYSWNDIVILLDYFIVRAREFASMQSRALEKVFTEIGLQTTVIKNEDNSFQNALKEVTKVSRGKTKNNVFDIEKKTSQYSFIGFFGLIFIVPCRLQDSVLPEIQSKCLVFFHDVLVFITIISIFLYFVFPTPHRIG